MAPTLQGRHQDVDCPMCGYAYRLSASQEIDQATEHKRANVIAGECPNCRFWACTNRREGEKLLREGLNRPFNQGALEASTESSSANGDRIIVSKFAYEFQDPQRWDIFVFRFPGQASRNYIKRLVGLPGDRLMIYRGDIFRASGEAPPEKLPQDLKYGIERSRPIRCVRWRSLSMTISIRPRCCIKMVGRSAGRPGHGVSSRMRIAGK